jgi:hypothetical protein
MKCLKWLGLLDYDHVELRVDNQADVDDIVGHLRLWPKWHRL